MAATHESQDARHAITRRGFMNRTAAATLAAASAATARRAYGANERLGVGFIGTGGRGGAHMGMVNWLKDNGGECDIVAVCDVYRPRVHAAAEHFNAKAYMDHRELLADPNVDVVCIATPDHHHGYQAIDAVQAGKHVYCEKPVTHWRQFELTKQLAIEVKKSGCVFQLGTQGMSDSAWHQMKKLVQEGLIGQPIHAETGFFRVGDWGERGMPVDDPNAKPGADLNWEAFLGDAPKREFDVSRFFRWRMYEDYAGGPSTDLFPHTLTPVMHILGVTMPSLVVATGGKFRYDEREVPDTFNMLMDYPEKITVAVLGTQGNPYQATGQRGSGQRVPVIRGWEGALTIEGEEIVFIPVDDKQKQPQRIPIEHPEDFAEYWRRFLECCRSGNPQTLSSADLAYHTQTALIMGMWSLRDGKAVRFDTDKQTIVL
ncbi:MAG TPA: Gfo/Idh/MocA family oxidoreductase [Candidatus Hydrogenedentes bacterium]|nr:Gfo/Idh/MocA family oxidoreductase [Candidatus Hydrogenedentota bacterium]HPG67880.1 Gfo/Idh/MocA family oxidoreductase [Candidatus Hydrogenedentota bacterium]